MTTIVSSLAALSGIAITGVKTIATEPPARLTTASLPLAYPRRWTIETKESFPTLGSAYCPLKTLRVEYVVIIEAARQNTVTTNWNLVNEISDNLIEALEANSASINLENIEMRSDYINVGDAQYYAIESVVWMGI